MTFYLFQTENIGYGPALHRSAALGEPGLESGGTGGLDEAPVADGRTLGLEIGARDPAVGTYGDPHNDLPLCVPG